MTPEYQLIQQIVQLTDSDQLERSPVLEEFAEQFAELCHETNARLQRCAEYLDKGMRSEAVHEAQSPPALIELVKALEFDGRRKWGNICADLELAQPPPLNTDVIERLTAECSREQELEPLLKEYRRGVYQGDREACIRVLRQLREKDPDNPSWPENLRPLEEAQLPTLLDRTHAALESGDLRQLAELDRELRHPLRVVAPPTDLLARVKDALLEERRRETALEGDRLSRQIAAAAETQDGPRLASLLEQWETLEQDEAFRPARAMSERVDKARGWFAEYREQETRKTEFQTLIDETWDLLGSKPAAADILKRRQELRDRGLPVPESLEQAIEQALRQFEQRRKNRRRLISAVILLLVLAGIGSGAFLWHKKQREMRQARMLAHMDELQRNGKAEELDAYLKAISERDTAFYSTPEVRAYREQVIKTLREHADRQQRFTALMDQLDHIRATGYAAGDEAIRNLLAEAAETTPGPKARATLKAWKQGYENWKSRATRKATDELERVTYMIRQIIEQKERKPFASFETEAKALAETTPLLEEGKPYLDGAAPAAVKEYNRLAVLVDAWKRDLAERRKKAAAKDRRLRDLRHGIPRALPDLKQYETLLRQFVKEFPDEPEAGDYRRALDFLPAWTAAVALQNFELRALPGPPGLTETMLKMLDTTPGLKQSAWGPDLEDCLTWLTANARARSRIPLLLAAKSETLNLQVTRYRKKGEKQWKVLYSPKPLVSRTEVDKNGDPYQVYWGRVYYYEKKDDKPWLTHTSKVFPNNLDTREFDVKREKRRQDNLVGHGKFLYRFAADATDAREIDVHVLEGIGRLCGDIDLPLVPRAWLLQRLVHFLDDNFGDWIPETRGMVALVDRMDTDVPWMNPEHPAVLAAEKEIRALLPKFPPVEPIITRLRTQRRVLTAALSRKLHCVGVMQPGRDHELTPHWVSSPGAAVWILAAHSPSVRPGFKIAAKVRKNGGILFSGTTPKEHFAGQLLLAPGDKRTAKDILRQLLPDEKIKQQLHRPASWPVNAW